MGLELAVLVPVLGRPHRVRPLLDSIAAATKVEHRVLFLASPSDALEVAAIERENAELWAVQGNYPRKIREGVEVTDEPFLFFGADDLDFQPGWFEAARARLDEGAEVVGVNDEIPRKRRPSHAAHFLVTRRYAQLPTADGGAGPLHDGYIHWYCDDEFVATAESRGVYAYAEDAVVTHLHPMVGKAPDDETYLIGRQHRRTDKRRFKGREKLWT